MEACFSQKSYLSSFWNLPSGRWVPTSLPTSTLTRSFLPSFKRLKKNGLGLTSLCQKSRTHLSSLIRRYLKLTRQTLLASSWCTWIVRSVGLLSTPTDTESALQSSLISSLRSTRDISRTQSGLKRSRSKKRSSISSQKKCAGEISSCRLRESNTRPISQSKQESLALSRGLNGATFFSTTASPTLSSNSYSSQEARTMTSSMRSHQSNILQATQTGKSQKSKGLTRRPIRIMKNGSSKTK